jgi:hypothetical protein
MDHQAASRFGYRVREVGGAWRWTAFDTCGRVRAQGHAPTRAAAAAFVIRALAQEALAQDALGQAAA